MNSKVERFMENSPSEELLALKRIELIDLAGHLGVSIKTYFKKHQILDEVIVNLVDNEILEEKAMEYVSKEEGSEGMKINQMELQFEREKQEKEMQLREKEIQVKKEIKERELEARIFIEKEKLHHFDVLNTLVSVKMKLTSIFFFLKK